MPVLKIMYEVNWHYKDNGLNSQLTGVTVTPIRVLREGVLPGCTGISITALDHQHNEFIGTPGAYFNTPDEAWASARAELARGIDNVESGLRNEIATRQRQIDAMRQVMASINPPSTT